MPRLTNVLVQVALWWLAGPISGAYSVDSTPNITLPWGTWEGKLYGSDGDYYLFPNIRYAKAPVKDLRFAAPKEPDPISNPRQIQDSSFGPNCVQANASKEVDPSPFPNSTQSEDCLFLDVYVPDWAFELEEPNLPVVVWLYGGAYVFGSKNVTFNFPSGPFNAYDGAGIRRQSRGNVIWVTGNYRMGAYGFLAGKTMEKDAQPNAGLLDQRLILEWVQKYIAQVKGDKDQVSVWGLSAGAGSILHHLTAYGGEPQTKTSLFNKAVLWSTAFQWSYDRKGTLEDTFLNFTDKSSCGRDPSKALKCLRELPDNSNKLRLANQQIVSENIELGMFPFGPAVDGKLVPELPATLLNQGKHVKVDSVILAHDFDEASLFLAKWVKTSSDFTRFLNLAFPGTALSDIRKSIEEKYPVPDDDDDDDEPDRPKQRRRMLNVLRDSTFVCNKYQAFKAFQKNDTPVYATRYDMPPAKHGVDLFPLMWDESVELADYLKKFIPGELDDGIIEALSGIWHYFARSYQTYFTGHALTGDPNYLLYGRSQQRWDRAEGIEDGIQNSLRIGFFYGNSRHPFFGSGIDYQVNSASCDFWTDVASKITKLTKSDVDGAGSEYASGSEIVVQVPELELR